VRDGLGGQPEKNIPEAPQKYSPVPAALNAHRV
jgi:hypothetical protein